MKVLDLCDSYFLGLIVIQSMVLILVDVRSFGKKNMRSAARKCKKIGGAAIVIGVVLFIIKNII